MTKMTYEETLSWIHGQKKFGPKPGVKRMEWLLKHLGSPEKRLKGVHVIGTNGKGSTVNYLQHIFSRAGYDVGTFVSPYIMDFRERISLNGQMISKEELVALAEVVRPVVERLPQETDLGSAIEFEIITTMMFVYFGQVHPVDIAIIEAGIGGLYDSTNVFQALAVVCPSIGLDHQAYLGKTHAAIASNKAGVLKGGEPFIYATDNPQVRAVFQNKAKELSCPTLELGIDFSYEISDSDNSFTYHSKGISIADFTLSMPGVHQLANASLAIQTALCLQPQFPKVDADAIRKGLAEAKWIGRTEMITPHLMLDGAHNDESIAALVALLKQEYPDQKIHILFAAIDTKPVTTMLEQLSVFDSLEVTSFSYPNALPLSAYPQTYPRVDSFEEWIDRVIAQNATDLFVITGSLYFISQVRSYLVKKSI